MVDDTATDADWNALYIGGEQAESESGENIAVEDPSAREMVAHVPRETEADVDVAYEAAAEAQESWTETPPMRWQEVVEQFLQVLNGYEDEIIDLLAHEAGGSRIMGETSIQITSDHASEAAMLPRRMCGEYVASNISGKENIVQENPEGMVMVISSWNSPLNLSIWAVAPVVAAGDAVVLKPLTNSPITGGLLSAKLSEETGFLESVVNIVADYGSGIGNRIIGHPESGAMAFTGSIEVGKRVLGIVGGNLVVPAMELGGNNAHVVTESAGVDCAADAAVFGSSVRQGQVCISINRHIVYESVYDEYAERLTERAAELPTGSAHEGDTVVGPIIDESQRDEMLGCVEETVAAGAALETGGSTVDLDGVDDSPVVQPTVFSDVTNDMVTACNKHFGPIASAVPFSDVDEAVGLANAAEYGPSGSVHAGDLATDKEIALRTETGSVHINDQPTNDEMYVPSSDAGTSNVGAYNSGAFLDEITENRWASLQYEPRDYPL